MENLTEILIGLVFVFGGVIYNNLNKRIDSVDTKVDSIINHFMIGKSKDVDKI